MKLATIVTTGTPGAARGALEAADELGLKVGGHTAATDLPPAIAERLRSTLAPRMAARLNVQDSDGTLIVSFSTGLKPGSPAAYADEAVEQQRKASLHVVLPDGGRSAIPEDVRKGVLAWIAEEKIATLHVTGPLEREEPGIQQAVHDALVWIFEDEVKQSAAVLTFAGAVQTAAEIAEADGNARARAMFAGVDRTAAPESLREALDEERAAFERAAERHEEFRGTVVETIARIAADLPNRLVRPPLTTEDALRQIAATGDDDARLQALAELAHRNGDQPTHLAINPANVDAAIAAGLDVVEAPPIPPEVLAARDQQLAANGPASLGLSQEMLGAAPVREVPRAEATSTMTLRGHAAVRAERAAHPGEFDRCDTTVPPPALGQPWTRDNWLWCGCAGPHGSCPNERCTNHKDAPWP